ncbi:hypothetical protein DPEC_G00071720 [Dallia pectoralis]|uniref:Uncharacterized protein n=1 Tax=Dallia pectoralis TaxID=75939 RepID=A0ACC2H269_DALPE|nr:hypothetical protein DPEC_G00071720 [Dallia pectoralis]
MAAFQAARGANILRTSAGETRTGQMQLPPLVDRGKGRDIFNTWTLTDDEAKKLQTYYDKYTAYLTWNASTANKYTSTEAPSHCLTYLLAHLSVSVRKMAPGDLQR